MNKLPEILRGEQLWQRIAFISRTSKNETVRADALLMLHDRSEQATNGGVPSAKALASLLTKMGLGDLVKERLADVGRGHRD